MKGVDERINEGVLWWFAHVEGMEKGRIAKRQKVGDCAGSCSVGRLRKRWIYTMKDCLRMVQGRSEWWGFVRGSAHGIMP